MWRNVFFLLFCLLFCLYHVSAQDQRFYLISETEVQSIEQAKQSWETSKQVWLSQVSALKTEVVSLQTESQTLNSKLAKSVTRSTELQAELISLNKALAAERRTTQLLKKSFNEYEAEKLQQLTSLSSEIASQREKTLDAEKKLSFWRLLAIAVISGTILVIVLLIYIKLKPKLPIP